MTELAQPPSIGHIFHFDSFDGDRFVHGITGRAGGVSDAPFASLNLSVKTGDDPDKVEANRRAFEALLGIESRQVAFGKLRHGDDVAVFQVGGLLPPLLAPNLGWPMFEADSAISNVPGLVLVMTFADCVPILLWDPATRACALVHAGWRGTAARIASKTVRTMSETFGSTPETIHAGIGPSIGSCCYPVSDDVRTAMTSAFGGQAGAFFEGDRLDLWLANRYDLLSAGLTAGNIEISKVCTGCHTELYFSHRREAGMTGRFGAAVGVRDPHRFNGCPSL